VDLGLGNQIAGLVGGAAGQALGVGIGGAGLITGAAALVTGRTSGGVNSNVFQTINGSTQLQFSTIGAPTNSVFLTTNSLNPLTTPGLEISTTISVPAGTYCVRSVGDPLYINNNVSSIQMFGQWVPVIQPTATIGAVAVSSLGVSSINGATYPPPGGGGIPSTLAASSITVNGALTQSGLGTFNWGGNTMSLTQVNLARPTAVNNTLTTTGAAFLNAGATVNSGLTVASGGANVTGGLTVPSGNVTVNNSLFVYQILQGQTVQALGSLSVGGGGISIVGGGINMAAGNLTMNNGSSVANITNVNVGQNLNVNQTITANVLNANGISTTNINVFTINNQTYPPPAGPATIPSTLNASTINFNGGLTNTGSAPINTNTITATNANVNFYNGNSITATSISTTNISTNNINVNTINNAPYPPGGGGGSIPSTLNASTLNVNGGQTISNGGLTISGGGTITGGGTWKYRMANVASAVSFEQAAGNNDSIILDLNADKTTRFYSTLLVRDSTWPSPQPSGAAIRTYDTSDPAPYGSVITSNVSTNTLQVSNTITGGNVSTNSISTNTITATTINANTMNGTNGSITNLNVSSINGGPYPPLSPPVGSIIIWAGGSDDGGVQNFNVPTGWLVCNGSEQSRLEYANLFGVIGLKYSMNKPVTGLNFYLPDLTFAVPMGTPFRNYASTIDTPVQFQVNFQTWQSDFVNPAISTMQTWKITQTIGGTLNYGTLFPAAGFTLPSFPNVYVSKILSYDGNQGYIVVRSVNNTPIPSTGSNVSFARANGTVAQDASGTYLYTLGSYGANSAYPQVTHNQTLDEVVTHDHLHAITFPNPNTPGNGYVGYQEIFTTTSGGGQGGIGYFSGALRAPDFIVPNTNNLPTNPVTVGVNNISTISSFNVSANVPPYENPTNVGTYTAPNFINMVYLIKF